MWKLQLGREKRLSLKISTLVHKLDLESSPDFLPFICPTLLSLSPRGAVMKEIRQMETALRNKRINSFDFNPSVKGRN